MDELHQRQILENIQPFRQNRKGGGGNNLPIHERPGVVGPPCPRSRDERAQTDLGDDQRAQVVDAVTSVLSTQLRRGDFFLCASERQRHFWLGHLAALGRLSPTVYDADPKLLAHRGIALLAAPFTETERVDYLDKA